MVESARFLALRWLFAVASAVLVTPARGEGWAKDVAAHFVEPHLPEHVHAEASKANKTAMVIVMTTWCGACNNLRISVNSGTKVKSLLDKFTVAYSEDEEGKNAWQEHGQDYVPQVYFFSPSGKKLGVHTETEKYKYFFSDENTLERGMKEALALTETGGTGGNAHELDASIKEHFSQNVKPAEMQAKALELNRPFMALVTQEGCDACQDLIQSINGGYQVKDLLDSFLITHAHSYEALRDWQPDGENYVPQVLFFDTDGTLLDVKGPHAEYKYFYSDETEMASGMSMALDASKAAGEL